jgi:hypothetical protein
MYHPLCVEIGNSRYELSKESGSVSLFQISMCEDVVEQLAT